MSKRKNVAANVQGFATNPVDKALYEGEETEETDALFSALSDMKRGNAAIVTHDGGAMLYGWQMTPTGLIPPDGLQEAQYREFGAKLFMLDNSMQWLVGDFITIGDNFQWGETYQRLADETGKDPNTLKDWAYVCRNVKMSERSDDLSFNHHKLVASMTPDEQAYWLERAAAEGLSIAKLRKAIKESQLPPPEPEEEIDLNGFKVGDRVVDGKGWTGVIRAFSNRIAHVVDEVTRNEFRHGVDGLRPAPPELQHRVIASGNDHDIDELNAKMPDGVTVEHVGTYSDQGSFDHDKFKDMQKAWDKARDAFAEVRSVHMSALTHGSVPRSTRKRAQELIRMLQAHLTYIESELDK